MRHLLHCHLRQFQHYLFEQFTIRYVNISFLTHSTITRHYTPYTEMHYTMKIISDNAVFHSEENRPLVTRCKI